MLVYRISTFGLCVQVASYSVT